MRLLIFSIIVLTGYLYGTTAEYFQPHMEDVNSKMFHAGHEMWGYTEVRQGAHMFWWLHYTTHRDGFRNRPWIIWLQGGPGLSSTGIGLFLEIGPYDQNLKPREHNWVSEASVIYIDQPVGTGFSYAEDESQIPKSLDEIVEDLITFLSVFLDQQKIFRELPLYLFGQSYGGKYVSALAYHIERKRADGTLKFDLNLKGIGIGNGFVSPQDSIDNFGPYLLQTGIIDDSTARELAMYTAIFDNHVNSENWEKAFEATGPIFEVITRIQGLDVYNILLTDVKGKGENKRRNLKDNGLMYFSIYDIPLHGFMDGEVRRRLRIIPDTIKWNEQNMTVYGNLIPEFMKPLGYMVDWLLWNTDVEVNVYEGQFDLMCSTAGSLAWVNNLEWAMQNDWPSATRRHLTDPETGKVEMYVKEKGNLRFFWNLKAGHAVPASVPAQAQRMLRMILGKDKESREITKNLIELLKRLLSE